MKGDRGKRDEAQLGERLRVAGPLDSGETRAIMIGAVVLTIFLYLIKLILLPFVLASIVAYICTPLLDWAAKRTGWPRLLFAVVLFLLFLGLCTLVVVFAGERLVTEMRGIAAEFHSMLENFAGQAMGGEPIHLFGIHVERSRYRSGRAGTAARLVRTDRSDRTSSPASALPLSWAAF